MPYKPFARQAPEPHFSANRIPTAKISADRGARSFSSPILPILTCITVVLATSSLLPFLNHSRFSYTLSSTADLFTPVAQKFPFETFSVQKASAKHPYDAQFASKLHQFLHLIVTQYTTWHREQRHLCETSPTHNSSIPLLVNRITGAVGVGDCIRGLLYHYLIAVASKRLFLIDWQTPVPIVSVLHNPPGSNFTYDAALFTSSENEEHIIKGPSKYQNLDVYFSSTRVVVTTSANPFAFKRFFTLYDNYPELKLCRKIMAAGLKRFRPQREEVAPFILKALFQSSPSLRHSLRKLMPFNGKPYISLHARLGHGLGERRGRFNFTEKGLTLPSASKCIGALAATRTHQLRYNQVFVATDTEHAKEYLHAGVHAVLPNATVDQSPIIASHMKAIVRARRFRRKSLKAAKFEELFVELGLLAMAESIVFFRSGFAEVAVWFGTITDSVLVTFEDCAQIVNGKNASGLLKRRRPKAFKELLRTSLQLQKHVSLEN